MLISTNVPSASTLNRIIAGADGHAKVVLDALLRNPWMLPRLVRACWYRGDVAPGPAHALLSSLAVAPEHQLAGVGTQLARAFVAEARRRGALRCFLVTDAHGTGAVNRFYTRLGWRLEAAYRTAEGRQIDRYVLDLCETRGS